MNVDEFRRHKFLPYEWRKLMATNGILQAVLQLMEENHPARFTVRGDKDEDISPTRAAIELGLTKGYSKYGDVLRLLAKPISPQQSIGEPTYEKPIVEEVTT